jgi:tetratricopeptide (TPR) repeat protein
LARDTPDRFGAAALGIFALALLIRLLHIWQIRRAPFFTLLMGDSHGYDEWALGIARGDWVGHEVFYQAPLYPYFLAVIYAAAGRNLLIVRVVQALVGSLSCVLLAYAGRRLFSPAIGLAAGVMLALYAPAIFFDGLLQKSVLDVFFICLSLRLISRIAVRPTADATRGGTAPLEPGTRSVRPDPNGRKSVRSVRLQPNLESRLRLDPTWLWLGLALGGLSLTRENALVFVVVIVAWALAGVRASGAAEPARVRAKHAALLLAGLAAVLVPVAVRNSAIGGRFYVTTSQFGPNFYIGNHQGADGTYQSLRFGRGAPEYERQDATELAEHALNRKLTPGEVSAYWTDRAVDYITTQPGAWLKLTARKMALLLNHTEMVDTEDQATHADWSWPLRVATPIGHFGVLVPLALLGGIVTWRDRTRLAVLYALALAYAVSVVLFYVFARYRYPLVPFLVLFAAAGLTALARPVMMSIAQRRADLPPPARDAGGSLVRRWQTIAAVVAAAIAVNWPIVSADAMRAVTETNVGVALQTGRRLDEAIAHYRRAIAVRPDYAPAYNNMATALRDEKRLAEAVAAYQQALRLKPGFAAAHYNFANLLLDEGDAEAAVDHFQRALGTEPASADVHNNLGIALAGTGRIDEAIDEFRRAIDLDPGSAKAYRNLGDALSSTGAHADAIAALGRAVQLDAGDAATRYDFASALMETGRLDDAIREFRATLHAAPDFVEAHNNLGIALGSQGRMDEAIEEFRRALQIQPGFADAQRNLDTALRARRR